MGVCHTRPVYKAVLDTCALVPGLQRDFLLQLAAEQAYAPLWGSGILFELDYVLAGLHERRGLEDSGRRRAHLFDQMERAFPGARVEAPKNADYDYDLNDPNDGHVAHTAIIGKADAIVTDDRRAGFRSSSTLLAANVETVYPQEFAANTVAAHPSAGIRALEAISGRRDATPASLLNELRDRYEMADLKRVLAPLLAPEPHGTERAASTPRP